jgi:hypothetical protein
MPLSTTAALESSNHRIDGTCRCVMASVAGCICRSPTLLRLYLCVTSVLMARACQMYSCSRIWGVLLHPGWYDTTVCVCLCRSNSMSVNCSHMIIITSHRRCTLSFWPVRIKVSAGAQASALPASSCTGLQLVCTLRAELHLVLSTGR